MKYVNPESGAEISLKHLTKAQREFYATAVELFRRNTPWLRFDEFAFGPRSPLYKNRSSHLDVISDPLYAALEDMWLQLGVQQGAVSREKKNEGRKQTRSRSAEEAADREESDHVAPAR